MKSRAIIVVLFSLLFLSVDGHATTRGARKDGSLLRPNNEILHTTPPSEKQIALEIARLREIKDFKINGWSVTFSFIQMNLELDKPQTVFRAIAERTGSARYSYRVSESRGDSADTIVLTVEQPVIMNACADGAESHGGYCDDGSSPR
jgi:hypothetical protein